MYVHPYTASKLDHDRHRDMRADIGQHRLARQLRDLARASRHASGTPHSLRRTWRLALRQRLRARA